MVPYEELRIERFLQGGNINHRWFHMKDGTDKIYLKKKEYGKIGERELKKFPIDDKTVNNKFLLSEEGERKYKNRISEIEQTKYKESFFVYFFVYILEIRIFVKDHLRYKLYKIGMSRDILARLTSITEDWQKKVKSKDITINMTCIAREQFDSQKAAKDREFSLKNMTEEYSLGKSDKEKLNKSFTNNPDGYTEVRKSLSPYLKTFIKENKVKY
tara:strand:- start:179 stop:823 length:645 start_codon:yes stop_codon:yes gene_type:complete